MGCARFEHAVVLNWRMATAWIMGLRYYAIVFAIAFALGVARTLMIAPAIGVTAAVLFEVPVLIMVSWLATRRLLRRHPLSLSHRALMGAVAFALTMASESILAYLLRGQDIAAWVAEVARPLGLVGLAGQIVFGIMPVLVGNGKSPKSAAP